MGRGEESSFFEFLSFLFFFERRKGEKKVGDGVEKKGREDGEVR